ncbi:hypothetical protein LAC30SC_00780 [Lactobacillus amylovorus]|uniref:Uncharacterized protein n=1 Tax=Lactobacillus amylovorus TaxID=1604 RepID=F0TI43_LACAM|nr:hypothetical protein LAC30SC_00780 [Lactobacillus amylovorus]TBH77620.1 hypothetical protein C1A34_02725 [Lactobacillus amylovorus]
MSIDHGCMRCKTITCIRALALHNSRAFFIGLQKNMADKLQDYLTNLKMHDAKYQTTFIYGAKEAIICYIS